MKLTARKKQNTTLNDLIKIAKAVPNTQAESVFGFRTVPTHTVYKRA